MLGSYTRLGSKVSETTIGEKIFSPCVVDLDLYRAIIPSLPPERFLIIFSSEHDATTGALYVALTNDIEAAWTINTTPVYVGHTGSAQTETPSVIFMGDCFYVYVHDSIPSGEPQNTQHTKVLRTVNFSSFTVESEDPLNGANAHHSGYATFFREYLPGYEEEIIGLHGLGGGEDWMTGISHSAPTNGRIFIYDEAIPMNWALPLGPSKILSSNPVIMLVDDQEYFVGIMATRPRATLTNLGEAVAIPINRRPHRAPRPINGYYRLFQKSATGTDPDNVLIGDIHPFEIDGQRYILSTGRTNAGVNHIVLYKESLTPAEKVDPLVRLKWTGGISFPNHVETIGNWDSRNSTPPAGIVTVTAVSGADASSLSAGSRYNLATNSGTQLKDLRCSFDQTFDPTVEEVIRFSVTDMIFNAVAAGQNHWFWIGDPDLTTLNGVLITTAPSTPGLGLWVYKANVAVVNGIDTHVLPANNVNANIATWARNYQFGIELVLTGFGTRLNIGLISKGKSADDSVIYQHTVDLAPHTLTWGSKACKAMIRLRSLTNPYPAASLGFSRMTLKKYNNQPLTSSSIIRGI